MFTALYPSNNYLTSRDGKSNDEAGDTNDDDHIECVGGIGECDSRDEDDEVDSE